MNYGEELRIAIDTLKTFNEQNNDESIVHVSNLEINGNTIIAAAKPSFKKNISLIKSFFSAVFSEDTLKNNIEKKSNVKEIVLKAIDNIKRHSFILERLSQGTLVEQRLAASAKATIEHFNSIILQQSKKTMDWSTKVAKFLLEQSGLYIELNQPIDLPKPHGYFPKKACEGEEKIIQTFYTQVSTRKKVQSDIDVRVLDAFRLKASSLLLQDGYSDNISQALGAVRTAPREFPLQKKSDGPNSLTLIQTVAPWPGIKVVIQGCFNEFAPISGSFKIESSHCDQLGFPDPSQYTGIALADSLIPPCPHRMDQLDLLEQLYKQKRESNFLFQPKERWAKKTRQLIKLTKEVFNHHKQEFLNLHKELALAILNTNIFETESDKIRETIESFFQALSDEEHPFEVLSKGYRNVGCHLIGIPYHQLQIYWANKNLAIDFNKVDASERFRQALNIFDEQIQLGLKNLASCYDRTDYSDFFISMGMLLCEPSKMIILQHLSENMRFPPPMLGDCEQKTQAWAYKQQGEFFEDLEQETSLQIVEQNLRARLQQDIALFSATSFEELEEQYPIPNLLEGYFNLRYLQSKKTM